MQQHKGEKLFNAYTLPPMYASLKNLRQQLCKNSKVDDMIWWHDTPPPIGIKSIYR